MDFTESRLEHLERREAAYTLLAYSMFLADNLGYIRVSPIRIDENASGILVVDYETGKTWAIALNHVRVRAQMRR